MAIKLESTGPVGGYTHTLELERALPLAGQWVLAYPGVDLVLGSSPLLPASQQRGYHLMRSPEVSEADLTLDDVEGVRRDGIAFGQDYRGATTITFELGLRGDDPDDAEELSNALLRAWRADVVRNTPGSVATLCTSRSGSLRQVYGRPRRVSVSDTNPRSAFKLATADFKTIDDLWYDVIPSTSTVGMVPAASGGFSAPFTVPLTVAATTERMGSIRVGGNAITWPRITIRGPILNPAIELVNQWRLQLMMDLPAGEFVVIDTRPWVRSVLDSNGGSQAGRLTRLSRLGRAWLAPGAYTFALRGTDLTGTASMTVTWNTAYVAK